MIRAVIFDLDGVVRRWPPGPTRAIESRHGLPAGAIEEAAFEPALLGRAVTGQITDRAWREATAGALEPAHGAPGRAAVADWSRLVGSIDPAVLWLVRDVRRLAAVALLSNASTRLADDLRALSIDAEFDVVAGSAELGHAKPDPAAFVATAALLGVECAACAFVDDDPRHVAAARAIGMTPILHRDVRTTRRALSAALDPRSLLGPGLDT